MTDNPFRRLAPPGWGIQFVETIDAQSRLDMVRKFDAEQLRAVISMPGVQKAVRLAAERRLRSLEREARPRCPKCQKPQDCNGLIAWCKNRHIIRIGKKDPRYYDGFQQIKGW